MRKHCFFIAVLFFSVYAVAQQTSSSEVVSAIMPKGSKHLTKDELTNYVHNNYRRSQVSPDRKNIYQLDGLLISFWDLSVIQISRKG